MLRLVRFLKDPSVFSQSVTAVVNLVKFKKLPWSPWDEISLCYKYKENGRTEQRPYYNVRLSNDNTT